MHGPRHINRLRLVKPRIDKGAKSKDPMCNLSPSHRPPQPSLNNDPVQRRVRRAFVATGQSALSTTHTGSSNP